MQSDFLTINRQANILLPIYSVSFIGRADNTQRFGGSRFLGSCLVLRGSFGSTCALSLLMTFFPTNVADMISKRTILSKIQITTEPTR